MTSSTMPVSEIICDQDISPERLKVEVCSKTAPKKERERKVLKSINRSYCLNCGAHLSLHSALQSSSNPYPNLIKPKPPHPTPNELQRHWCHWMVQNVAIHLDSLACLKHSQWIHCIWGMTENSDWQQLYHSQQLYRSQQLYHSQRHFVRTFHQVLYDRCNCFVRS